MGTEPADDGFVTVAEAARRLKVAPRQVRRYAARLSEGDTRRDTDGTGTGTAGGQSPLLVRFSAVSALRDDGKAQGQARDTNWDRDRDNRGTPGGQSPELLREIITRQDAEIANLRAALDKSQEATNRALAELQKANERAAVLIAATAGLRRLQLPDMPPPQNGAETPDDLADSGDAVTAPDAERVSGEESIVRDSADASQGDSGGFPQNGMGEMDGDGRVSRGKMDEAPNSGHQKSGWWARLMGWIQEH